MKPKRKEKATTNQEGVGSQTIEAPEYPNKLLYKPKTMKKKTLSKGRRVKREDRIKENLHRLLPLTAAFHYELCRAAELQKQIEALMKKSK